MLPRNDMVLGDRFDILRKLGEGARGVVHAAVDRSTGAHVALKELRTKRGDLLLRFKQEWRALQAVQHHNLVELYDLYNQGDSWFFTMELVSGRDFMYYVRRGMGESTISHDADTIPIGNYTPTLVDRQRGDTESLPRGFMEIPPNAAGGALDEGRLRASLAQLVRGL
ncbi:MAG: protein kinase, partial [Myxococcota bacterium]